MTSESSDGGILDRIIRTSGSPDIMEALASRLSLSDLQSLLLGVYRARATARSTREVLRQYRSNRFVRPAVATPIEISRLDQLAFSLLPEDFDPLELAPVSPLGSCSALGPVSQNKVLTTIRNTEVCADPTNVLALESAVRRSTDGNLADARPVKLCASHRVLRAQLFVGPASFPHFRVLSLSTAGRDLGDFAAQIAAVEEHLRFYATVILRTRELGFDIRGLKIVVIPYSPQVLSRLEESRLEELQLADSRVAMEIDRSLGATSNYYEHLRFQIHAKDAQSNEYSIVDGGFTSWTRQLLGDKREWFLGSGMGTERLIACFRRGGAKEQEDGRADPR